MVGNGTPEAAPAVSAPGLTPAHAHGPRGRAGNGAGAGDRVRRCAAAADGKGRFVNFCDLAHIEVVSPAAQSEAPSKCGSAPCGPNDSGATSASATAKSSGVG